MILDIPAHDIGSDVRELATHEQDALVMGASQYGIFLHLNSGRVIFLSYEGFRGPLTVNIGEDARDTLPLELGATARH